MKGWARVALLALVLLFSLSLHWAASPNPGKRNFRFAPEMATSPRLSTFDAYPGFPNGAVLQPPVPGTVPRGFRPLPVGAGPEEAQRAGNVLKSPLSPGDPRVTTRGAQLWANFCQPCHGAGGYGDGPVAQRGFPPPPSLHAQRARELADGQLYHIVAFGQQNMPAYGAFIGEEDRWLLVAFVRFLQQSPAKP